MRRVPGSVRKGPLESGYVRLSAVVETESLIVYRALAPDGQRVLVKIPAWDRPPASIVRQLEHELEVARELDPALVVRPRGIERFAGRTALILEDCAHPSLEGLLTAPLEAEPFLRIAIATARALADVHRRGLVHKDIKPANIFAGAGGEVKLTGFGVASRAPRERLAPGPPEVIDGTLAYMAPEQTGRMNRSIDSRSDLYALGVTFYRMLTGQLPFSASDPMEWIHCHLAFQPEPPSRRAAAIPEPLSEIVMKLMAKAAEDRYQTAEGLQADLERCAVEWREDGRVVPFPLGKRDIPHRLLIPEKLYGREREVETLRAAFGRVVASGRSEFLLVAGYSGVGKSAVVNELHRLLVRPRGLFASGKYDQYKRGIPYSTLAQAFESLIHQLLGKSEADLDTWRRALQDALGANGQLIAGLLPALKLVIGEQPPVPEVDPQQAKARFHLAFRRFIGVFARPEHPLVLFLDDLQWLDIATIDLIEYLLVQGDVGHLLLIGAYRDNEVGPAHALMRKLEAIRRGGARLQEIALGPLPRDDLTLMIADFLHCEASRARPLAALVHEKTAGNPFFAIQFLSALAQEGMIAFDHGEGRWSWNLERIHAKAYADNVADLMAGRLAHLPENTRHGLRQLACLGNSAPTTWLSLVLGDPNGKAEAGFEEAVRGELIQHFDGGYRFVHDRVQEAAYSLIPVGARAQEHLRIGRLLLAHTPQETREERVFEIVSQLNRGASLITSEAEREELAGLNLTAGKRAKASAAYASALSYFAAGLGFLTEDRWVQQHGLVFALEIGCAECEFVKGELAAAQQRLKVLSEHTVDAVEHAAVACLRIDLYTTLGENSRAVAEGLEFLQRLGITWSAHPTEEAARREYERIGAALGDRAIEDLLKLPSMTDPSSLATMDVLTKLAPPALFTDLNLLSLVVSRAVNLSLESGNSDSSSFAYVTFGMAGSYFGDYKTGFRFGQLGYALVDQRAARRFQAATYMTFGHMIWPWTRHVRASRDLLRRALDVATQLGDRTFVAYCCNNLVTSLFAAGDPLSEVQRQAEESLRLTQATQFGQIVDIIMSQLELIRNLRGLTCRFGFLDDEQFDELQFAQHLADWPDLVSAKCFHWIRVLQARFFADDIEAALSLCETIERLLWTLPAEIAKVDYCFFAALAHARSFDVATAEQRPAHFAELTRQSERLDRWAENCPANFASQAALTRAEIARIEDRPLEAMHLYEEAIQTARANGFVQHEAVANEVASRFYLGRGLKKNGLAHLRDARTCYALWGAEGKVKHLEALHPWLLAERLGPRGGISGHPEQLDVTAIVKAQRAVSGEIVEEQLARTLLRIVMENAGAQKGYLFVEPSSGVYAVAGEGRIEFQAASPTAPSGVAQSIINYVKRTRSPVLIADASSDAGDFSTDEHLLRTRPKSVLCQPIQAQTKLIGVVYLENSLTAGAFTPDRRAVLEILAAQAAISLQNARAYEEVREADRRKDEFIAMLSHELRNPLGPIRNSLYVLDRAAPGGQQAERARNIITRQVTHMTMLVDDILDAARISRGNITLHRESVDLCDLVRLTVEDHRMAFEANNVSLECVPCADELYAFADPIRLAQVIGNLLTNAVKFTPPGGHVRLWISKADDAAEIHVRDDGAGIRPEILPRLFQPFVQADSTLDRSKGGLGLGLAVAKGLVELHGGSIRAKTDSAERGAEFIVRIPVQRVGSETTSQ